jgi:hypothetical protein
MTDWEIHGTEFGNCNCAYGCPCQFNALPTHGHCRAIGFFRIDRGHHGQTKLDGLNMAIAVKWPGPVHGGNGELQTIIDERADSRQADALFRIMTGKDTDPMATFWAVYSAMSSKIHEPVRAPFRIEIDKERRRARCEAKGAATGRGEPILNPVTREEHRAQIHLPHGFEYTSNEVGRGWSSSTGNVAFSLEDSYAHWCELHIGSRGVMR